MESIWIISLVLKPVIRVGDNSTRRKGSVSYVYLYRSSKSMTMAFVLAAILSLIFMSLAIIHFYWVLGGKRWLDGAMPPEMREQVNRPERKLGFTILTAVVGLGLLGMALVPLLYTQYKLQDWQMGYLYWIVLAIGVLFTLRAVGDFNKVGLFQSKQTGVFAERDKAIYSPLCAFIGLGIFMLVFVF